MKDTLFFDGQCRLCAHEISLLRRWKGPQLNLVDIHSNDKSHLVDTLSNSQLLSVLHLKTADGTWLKGLDATVRAWRHTPFGFLLLPLRWGGIKTIADRLYLRWASQRACRLGYSDDCKVSFADQTPSDK